jgi:putative glycosyltransferase
VQLSIVTTLYRSEEFVDAFLDRAGKTAAALFEHYEIILVDDGSPDRSLEIARQRAGTDGHIVPVALSRNFGHHAAILAGLETARGELVFLVDSDLEEPPEYLAEFWQVMQAEKLDVVFGRHRQDQGSALRRWTSRGFWKVFSLLADVKVEENICHIRLMTREYVDALLSLEERNIFLGGLYSWPGFRQKSVLVERRLMRKVSTYSFRARLELFARSIVAFSAKPLYIIFVFGFVLTLVSILATLFVVLRKLFYPGSVLPGFTLLFASIWFLGGIIIMVLGVIGTYVAQIYKEVKRRPRYIRRIGRD